MSLKKGMLLAMNMLRMYHSKKSLNNQMKKNKLKRGLKYD